MAYIRSSLSCESSHTSTLLVISPSVQHLLTPTRISLVWSEKHIKSIAPGNAVSDLVVQHLFRNALSTNCHISRDTIRLHPDLVGNIQTFDLHEPSSPLHTLSSVPRKIAFMRDGTIRCVIFSFCHASHWVAVEAVPPNTINIFDSLTPTADAIRNEIQSFVSLLVSHCKGDRWQIEQWDISNGLCPKQDNTVDYAFYTAAACLDLFQLDHVQLEERNIHSKRQDVVFDLLDTMRHHAGPPHVARVVGSLISGSPPLNERFLTMGPLPVEGALPVDIDAVHRAEQVKAVGLDPTYGDGDPGVDATGGDGDDGAQHADSEHSPREIENIRHAIQEGLCYHDHNVHVFVWDKRRRTRKETAVQLLLDSPLHSLPSKELFADLRLASDRVSNNHMTIKAKTFFTRQITSARSPIHTLLTSFPRPRGTNSAIYCYQLLEKCTWHSSLQYTTALCLDS